MTVTAVVLQEKTRCCELRHHQNFNVKGQISKKKSKKYSKKEELHFSLGLTN